MEDLKSRLAKIAQLPQDYLDINKQISFDSNLQQLDNPCIPAYDNNANDDSKENIIDEWEGTPYDPTGLDTIYDNDQLSNKRFKISETEECNISNTSPINSQELTTMIELDNSNSIKLKKGNLIIRKYNNESGDYEVNELWNTKGYTVIDPNYRPTKSVRYLPDHSLEMVKYFRKDAEPTAPPLTINEVQDIQRNLENAKPEESKAKHIFSNEEDKRDGINKDKKKVLETMKMKIEQEELEIAQLQNMQPMIQFKRGKLRQVYKSSDFELGNGEYDNQKSVQETREKSILCKIYYQEENIPECPSMINMRKWSLKRSQQINPESLSKLWKEQEALKQQELKKSLMQSKHLLIKLLKLENLQSQLSINDLKQRLDKDATQNLNNEQLNTLANHINSWYPNTQHLVEPNSINFGNNTRNMQVIRTGFDTIPIAVSPYGMMQNSGNSVAMTEQVTDSSWQNSASKTYPNKYRTQPCKNYHSSQGCGRGIYCHFIHLQEFEGKDIPEDIIRKARVAYSSVREKCQDFLTFEEIMEYAIKHKQSQLTPKLDNNDNNFKYLPLNNFNCN